ncbi:MAG TPA: response regulator transcription factor [Longimicrobium sp.]|nr:response regulator transcription factor [Longimicrobium sp.]
MADTKILVIDDEPQIRRVVRNALEGDGVRVLEAATGREGIDRVAAERPDLVVLDLGLADVAGASVCAEIRGWSSVPILVLSARYSEHEKVALLDAGADDFVTKPFSTAEFQARVRAQLRRSRAGPRPGGDGPVELEGLRIDLARRVLSRDGAEIHLTPTEWDLLRAFVANAGRTLTHDQIFRAVWGRATGGDPQAYLRVHVANLRRKIERDAVRPTLIVTEPGVGYRFRALD